MRAVRRENEALEFLIWRVLWVTVGIESVLEREYMVP